MPKVLIRRRLLLVILVVVALFLSLAHISGLSRRYGASTSYPLPDRVTLASNEELPPFAWQDLPMQNPITSMIPLPTGEALKIPKIQHDFSKVIEGVPQKKLSRDRIAAVKAAFEHSWKGYKEHAWLHDEVSPLSGGFKDPFGGWGATLVDTLDTLWIMGMKKDFEEAVNAAKGIDFTQSVLKDVNVFETTIRYLGGFLSAYDLSKGKYPVLLDKAIEVGDMLYRAFDTPNHMPITRWNWKEYVMGRTQVAPSSEVVAEFGSLSLEFTRLSQLTHDPKYYDVVQRVSDVLRREQNLTLIPGLWPLSVNARDENMHADTSFTLGGMADSVYEYLPKAYLLLAGRNEEYMDMHMLAVDALKRYLVFEPLLPPSTSRQSSRESPMSPLMLGTSRVVGKRINLEARGEHLTCFAGGMIALGARAMSPYQTTAETAEDMKVARRLVQGCVWSYMATPTGIGPEIFFTHPCRKGRDAVSGGLETDWNYESGECVWSRQAWMEHVKNIPKNERQWEEFVQKKKLPEGFTSIQDAKYILRPEAIESVFMMYRITGDGAWQNYAWKMFEHISAIAKTNVAFASIPDVMDKRAGAGTLTDSMESFWTAETLKYLFLIFSDERVVSLDEYVFNTEAHPFRWRTPSWW